MGKGFVASQDRPTYIEYELKVRPLQWVPIPIFDECTNALSARTLEGARAAPSPLNRNCWQSLRRSDEKTVITFCDENKVIDSRLDAEWFQLSLRA